MVTLHSHFHACHSPTFHIWTLPLCITSHHLSLYTLFLLHWDVVYVTLFALVVVEMLQSLHSLQQENQRLQDQILSLTAKRERLQLLNTELAVSFPPHILSFQGSMHTSAQINFLSSNQGQILHLLYLLSYQNVLFHWCLCNTLPIYCPSVFLFTPSSCPQQSTCM